MTVANTTVVWYLFKVLGGGLLFGFAARAGWLYGRYFLRLDDDMFERAYDKLVREACEFDNLNSKEYKK